MDNIKAFRSLLVNLRFYKVQSIYKGPYKVIGLKLISLLQKGLLRKEEFQNSLILYEFFSPTRAPWLSTILNVGRYRRASRQVLSLGYNQLYISRQVNRITKFVVVYIFSLTYNYLNFLPKQLVYPLIVIIEGSINRKNPKYISQYKGKTFSSLLTYNNNLY